MVKRFANFILSDLVDYLSALILAIVTILVISQVVFRYVIDQPLAWSEELARYLIIWLTFLGASIGIRKYGHIRVEILSRILPQTWRRILQLLIDVMIITFLAIMVWQGVYTSQTFMVFKSSAMSLPQGYVFLSVPVGAAVMIYHIIVRKK